MYWRIEWEFHDALLPTKLVEESYDETLVLADALNQYLEVQVVSERSLSDSRHNAMVSFSRYLDCYLGKCAYKGEAQALSTRATH